MCTYVSDATVSSREFRKSSGGSQRLPKEFQKAAPCLGIATTTSWRAPPHRTHEGGRHTSNERHEGH